MIEKRVEGGLMKRSLKITVMEQRKDDQSSSDTRVPSRSSPVFNWFFAVRLIACPVSSAGSQAKHAKLIKRGQVSAGT